MTNDHLLTMTNGIVKTLGLCFIFWLLGLLVLIPLADPNTLSPYIVAVIVLIPITILFLGALPRMMDFARKAGEAQHKRRKTWIDQPQPFIHFWYMVWIVLAAILFVPLLYYIIPALSGLILFTLLLLIALIFLLNFEYVSGAFVRYMSPEPRPPQPQPPSA